MPSIYHDEQLHSDNHAITARTYEDIAERDADTEFNTAGGNFEKVVGVRSPPSFYILADWAPTTWVEIGSVGGTTLPFDAITDPAIDAAVTTAIIDINGGTVITLTTAGNSQTLASPTVTDAGKNFVVINNESNSDSITVEGVAISPGQFVEFYWDFDAWIILASGAGASSPGGATNDIQRNNGGAFAGSSKHTFDPTTNRETVLGDIEQRGGTATELYTPTQVSATGVGANPRFSVVQANYLYVCDANDNDLRIFDVTDPAVPALISTLVIGGGRGLEIAGRYLYYADEDNGGRLVIVDVIDKANPVVVGSIVTGGAPRGVRVQGRFAFVTYNTSTDGFRSFDVSDPTAPILLDSFNLASPGRTDFDISSRTAALPGSSNVQLVDISDPSNLTAITFASGDSHSAKFQGRYMYTARENTPEQFEIYDIASNPSSPTLVGSLALTVPPSVRAISVSGNYAYTVDASNNDMLVIDISDPTNPVAISTAVSVGLNPIAITTVGRYAYVLDNNGDQFLIFDVSGIDAQNLNVGNIDAGNINLRGNLKMDGALSAGGATFGFNGVVSDGPVVAKGHLLGGLPDNVQEIYRESDLPIVGSTIELVQGVVYELRRSISTDKQIIIPDTGGGFIPATLRSSNKELNTLTSTGTGSGFITNPVSGQGQLVLQNIIITQTGSRVFVEMTGNAQTELLLELDDTTFRDFDEGSILTNCIFNVNNASFWTGSGAMTLIDCESNISEMFTANFTDSFLPTFDVKSSTGSVTPVFFSVRNSKLSSQANEAFFMVHSNLISGSTVRINGVEASPFTPGSGAFFDSQSGSITALADSGGAPGVRTVVTSAGHNVADGDTIIQAGFTTETQMNGTFIASDILTDSYEVVAVFGGTDTGTWQNDSLDQSSPLVTAFDNPGIAEGKTIGSCHVKDNSTETTITTQGVYTDLDLGTVLEGSNISRWSLTDTTTGELTYIGIEPILGTTFVQLSATGASGSPEYRFRVVKNGSVLPDDIPTVLEAPASNISSVGLLAPVSVVNGDTIRLQVVNIDNTTNITISHLSMSIQ